MCASFFYLVSKIIIEKCLVLQIVTQFFHFMRNCKKQENKNLFGGTPCINLIFSPMLGQKILIVLTRFTKTID